VTPEMLLNIGLSTVLAIFGWILKSHVDEVKRLQILLNRTREDYATRADVHSDINRVLARIDNLDTKITVGTSANPATLYAATSVNTAGRRAYAGSAAQVSTNSIVLTADTTVQAIVSIATSTVAAGSVIVHVVIG